MLDKWYAAAVCWSTFDVRAWNVTPRSSGTVLAKELPLCAKPLVRPVRARSACSRFPSGGPPCDRSIVPSGCRPVREAARAVPSCRPAAGAGKTAPDVKKGSRPRLLERSCLVRRSRSRLPERSRLTRSSDERRRKRLRIWLARGRLQYASAVHNTASRPYSMIFEYFSLPSRTCEKATSLANPSIDCMRSAPSVRSLAHFCRASCQRLTARRHAFQSPVVPSRQTFGASIFEATFSSSLLLSVDEERASLSIPVLAALNFSPRPFASSSALPLSFLSLRNISAKDLGKC